MLWLMYVQSERAPNLRELAVLERYAALHAPPPEPSAPEADAGWLAALPWRRQRERAQRGRRRVQAMRHDRVAAWMRAPRVRVLHVEATRVAVVDRKVLIFDIGEGRLFALDDERFPEDDAPWPNSVFEFWMAVKPPIGWFRTSHLLCYGEPLQATEYSREEVEEHAQPRMTGAPPVRFRTRLMTNWIDVKEGVFPGRFEDVLGAYLRHVNTYSPCWSW